jgi:hypothetical protein
MLTLILPTEVTAFGGVQAHWWLAAAITLIFRSGELDTAEEINKSPVNTQVSENTGYR